MTVYNCGSLNIDRVFKVHDFVRPGETLASLSVSELAGGKGLNQSLALARAGATAVHVGCVGKDGVFLKELLANNGVDTRHVLVKDDLFTGQAMIQVADSGENAIVLYAGANHAITASMVLQTLGEAKGGDVLLLQNETSCVAEALEFGASHGLKVVFNPAPMTPEVLGYPLEKVDILIVNEVEAATLAENGDLRSRLPKTDVLLTLGSRGSRWLGKDGYECEVPAHKVENVVDTTAAGDTFIGYFLAA
ncbi:MAG: ribokinase, partial [Victivallales bacterium]|nr:ribokinase [Victivallales bacterium]